VRRTASSLPGTSEDPNEFRFLVAGKMFGSQGVLSPSRHFDGYPVALLWLPLIDSDMQNRSD
jgi:hypothetical protein